MQKKKRRVSSPVSTELTPRETVSLRGVGFLFPVRAGSSHHGRPRRLRPPWRGVSACPLQQPDGARSVHQESHGLSSSAWSSDCLVPFLASLLVSSLPTKPEWPGICICQKNICDHLSTGGAQPHSLCPQQAELRRLKCICCL